MWRFGKGMGVVNGKNSKFSGQLQMPRSARSWQNSGEVHTHDIVLLSNLSKNFFLPSYLFNTIIIQGLVCYLFH